MSFTVTNQQSGNQFEVQEDETILEAALRQGLLLPYGCRGGSCGACIMTVISGEVSYGNRQPLALNPDVIAAGKALPCIAHAKSDLVIDIHETTEEEFPVKTLPARIVEMNRLCHDVMELKLKLPASERLQFRAGQYIEILLKAGKRRAFSLANAPETDEFLELHVREVPGGFFTGQVFQTMKEKDLMRIEGPHGHFYLREDSFRPVILIAGGTGFAPVKSIVEHALATDFERPIHIYWGARDKTDLYQHELAESWAAENRFVDYTPVLSEPSDSASWEGQTGWVTDIVAEDMGEKIGACDVYLCGPPAMIQAGKKSFQALGLKDEHMFSDSFDFASDTLDAIAQAEK
ncbi:MAG: CDP-6-deoxy-delta-3,4-glucoseen reductase [Thiotrichales bacterium]